MNKRIAGILKFKESICVDTILENYFYDYVTGDLYQIFNKHIKIAGYNKEDGYVGVSVTVKKEDGNKINKRFLLHRIVWFLHNEKWPSNCIDHINGNRSDNRIENLRDVSHAENSRNREDIRNGKQLFLQKCNYIKFLKSKNKNNFFSVKLPVSYNILGHYYMTYHCKNQAEMAAHMCETGEFNPTFHNRRTVDHINITGNVLFKNMRYIKRLKKYLVVVSENPSCSKTFDSYKDAIEFYKDSTLGKKWLPSSFINSNLFNRVC